MVWVLNRDLGVLHFFRRVLSMAGFKVAAFQTVEDLATMWVTEQRHPQVVIIDLALNDVNGFSLCKWIRRHDQHVPLILTCSMANPRADPRDVLGVEHARFLQTPFSPQELIDAVASVLNPPLPFPVRSAACLNGGAS